MAKYDFPKIYQLKEKEGKEWYEIHALLHHTNQRSVESAYSRWKQAYEKQQKILQSTIPKPKVKRKPRKKLPDNIDEFLKDLEDNPHIPYAGLIDERCTGAKKRDRYIVNAVIHAIKLLYG
jgi:hypothetical protein